MRNRTGRINQKGYFLALTVSLLFLFLLVIITVSGHINSKYPSTRTSFESGNIIERSSRKGVRRRALGLNRVNQDTTTLAAIMSGQPITTHFHNDFVFNQVLWPTREGYG